MHWYKLQIFGEKVKKTTSGEHLKSEQHKKGQDGSESVAIMPQAAFHNLQWCLWLLLLLTISDSNIGTCVAKAILVLVDDFSVRFSKILVPGNVTYIW